MQKRGELILLPSYQDVQFVVFRNEYGKSEFAFQLRRDAKGMTDIPLDRYMPFTFAF
jgi:hypothetical protein